MSTATRRVPTGMRILKYRELKDYGVPYSRTYIDRLENEGKFPKRVATSTWRTARQNFSYDLASLRAAKARA